MNMQTPISKLLTCCMVGLGLLGLSACAADEAAPAASVQIGTQAPTGSDRAVHSAASDVIDGAQAAVNAAMTDGMARVDKAMQAAEETTVTTSAELRDEQARELKAKMDAKMKELR